MPVGGGAVAAPGGHAPGDRLQRRVAAQVVVVVQVLEAEGEGVEALQDEGPDVVDDQRGVAVVGEAGGEASGEVEAFVGASKQGDARVGGDAAGEIGFDGSLGEALGRRVPQGWRDTACTAPAGGFGRHKPLYINDLRCTDLPLSPRTMRYPG